MADYSIHQGPVPEWEDFVKATGFSNPSTQSLTPEQLRFNTNASRILASRALIESIGLRDRVTWRDYSILTRDQQNIIARVYCPVNVDPDLKMPVLLHFHGGGFLYGNVESEDASCSRIVAASPSPLIVVNVNYRHTPEYKHPTQHNDAWDSYLWLASNISALKGDPRRVVVGGVSAGGGLAASIALRYSKEDKSNPGALSSTCKLQGQVLCIPWLVHPAANPLSVNSHSSFHQNQNAPVLPWSALDLFSRLLGKSAETDPYFNVALAPADELVNAPKTALLVAGQDLLRDEGLYFAERLNQNGVPTKTIVFPGLPHGFRRFTQLLSTYKWENLIVESIQWCLREDSCSSFVVEQAEVNNRL